MTVCVLITDALEAQTSSLLCQYVLTRTLRLDSPCGRSMAEYYVPYEKVLDRGPETCTAVVLKY